MITAHKTTRDFLGIVEMPDGSLLLPPIPDGELNESGEDLLGGVYRDMITEDKPHLMPAATGEAGYFQFIQEIAGGQAPDADPDAIGYTLDEEGNPYPDVSGIAIDMDALRIKFRTHSAGGRPGW